MDEVHRSVAIERPEVPSIRICVSGVPNEAMAHQRGPDSRMVPTLIAGVQNGFDVTGVVNEIRIFEIRRPLIAQCRFISDGETNKIVATWIALSRLEADARRQKDRGIGMGEIYFDVSSHSSFSGESPSESEGLVRLQALVGRRS
jgi:hypothetical protein